MDSGGWTQVYAGDDLTYTDTAQSGWTSVQYRISAGISGVYGGLTVSNVVSITPVSSLVISGTDGNLGTITAPVAYSVTSDTGNQITVTEIINGHERTLTPTSGQLITIPVSMLDPGAGAITIKASVQAASGIVNQTRSWTYTKTPLALPVDPYRVERMQGQDCDIFPQTLAEAVFMPDGKSVAAYMDFIKTRATVVAGSYVGTGDYNSGTGWGSSNPTSLTFDFAPKLLIIGWQETLDNGFFSSNLGERVTSDNYYSIYTGALTTQFKQYRGFGDPDSSYAKKSSDGKTITWYSTHHANSQRNDKRHKYYYLAIG